MDARAGRDVAGVGVLAVDAHGTDLIHDLVEALGGAALGARDAEDLALGERLEAHGERAHVAAEEARHDGGGREARGGEDDLDPADEAAREQDLRVPQRHPRHVRKERRRGREHRERRVRRLPVRVVVLVVVLRRKHRRRVALRAHVQRPQQRHAKHRVLHVLQLLRRAAAQAHALHRHQLHHVLQQAHRARPRAQRTARNQARRKNHPVGWLWRMVSVVSVYVHVCVCVCV